MTQDRSVGRDSRVSDSVAGGDALVSNFMKKRVDRLLKERPEFEAQWVLETVMLDGLPGSWENVLRRHGKELLSKYYQSMGDRCVCSDVGAGEVHEAHGQGAAIVVRDLYVRKGDRESLLRGMEEAAAGHQEQGYGRLAEAMREVLSRPLKAYKHKEGKDTILTEPATYVGWRESREGWRRTRTAVALFRLSVSLKVRNGRTKTRMERVPRLVVRVERVVAAEASEDFSAAMRLCVKHLVESVTGNALSALESRFEDPDAQDAVLSYQKEVPVRLMIELEDDAHPMWEEIHEDMRKRLDVPEKPTAMDLRSIWLFSGMDVGWLETVKLSGRLVREAEAAADEVRKAKSLTKARPAPGEEFLLLAFFVDTLLRRDDGRYEPRRTNEFRSDLIEEWGVTPEELLKQMGVKASWFDGKLDWDETQRRVLEAVEESGFETDDFASEIDVVFLARDAARLSGRGNAVESSDLVLRLLIDSGTGATFARLAPRDGPLALSTESFLTMATGGAEKDSMGFNPSQLKVAKNLLEQVEGVEKWCADRGVALVRPSSGFDAGAHHVKAWKQELGSGYDFWEMGKGKKSASLETLIERTKSLSMQTTGSEKRSAREFCFVKVGTTVDYEAWQKAKDARSASGGRLEEGADGVRG